MSTNNGRHLLDNARTPAATVINAAGAYPVVRVNEQPRTILRQSVQLLLDANDPPSLFRYRGRLVTVNVGGHRSGIEFVTSRGLYKRLVELADWIRVGRDSTVAASPPAAIVQAILEDPGAGFPELDGVTDVPLLGPDFRVVDRPGYDEAARLYLSGAHDLESNALPEVDGAAARALLLEALHDFPFVDDASRAHAVALLLLPFVRPALNDTPSPLHLIEAPTPGSGKGRLADLVSVIATGAPCRPTSLSSSKSETAKKLAAILASGAPLIVLDNLPFERVLDDPVLASVLTSASPTERLLGHSTMLQLKNRAVWMATANNPRATMELARRCVRIRLDPACDRPWLRTDFQHPDLLGWARMTRPRLVAACLRLAKDWVERGKPPWDGPTLGSFEAWASVLGGILAEAGISGFLGNVEEGYLQSDESSEDWRALVQVWWRQYGAQAVKASDICELCLSQGLLDEVLGYGGARSQVSRLGRALQQHTGRVFDRWKLVRDRLAVRSSARYALLEMPPACSKPARLEELAVESTGLL